MVNVYIFIYDGPPSGRSHIPPSPGVGGAPGLKKTTLFDDKKDLLQSINSIMQTYNYTTIILNIYLRVL